MLVINGDNWLGQTFSGYWQEIIPVQRKSMIHMGSFLRNSVKETSGRETDIWEIFMTEVKCD